MEPFPFRVLVNKLFKRDVLTFLNIAFDLHIIILSLLHVIRCVHVTAVFWGSLNV